MAWSGLVWSGLVWYVSAGMNEWLMYWLDVMVSSSVVCGG